MEVVKENMTKKVIKWTYVLDDTALMESQMLPPYLMGVNVILARVGCPLCRKAKIFFNEHKIPFTYIDYDLADETIQKRILKEVDATGVNSFPSVKINDEVIVGYQPERYAKALGL